jgi:ABC-type glycerol-3-phosphate transport system substrate-binding protein
MLGRVRGWCVLTALVGVALSATLLSCTTEQSGNGFARLQGARLVVLGAWSGSEQRQFEAVLHGFTERTGASVTYVSAEHSVPAALDARFAGGAPPDVALLPQPGLLRHYAAAQRLVPLDSATSAVVRRDYSPIWQSLASADDTLYGVWFKAANKSLLWYDVGAFERAGMAPPDELGGLLNAARALRASGVVPFSVGGADEWTLTDWFENLYLQLAGPHDYDLLAAHDLAWTDPSVKTTLDFMAQLLAPQFLRGGLAGALGTGFEDSVARAFSRPPGAAMVAEGDFVAGVITAQTKARIGIDVDVAPFPAAHSAVPAVVGGGDVAVQLRSSPAAAELMRYLATPAAAAIWAAAGGFISANLELDLSAYPDDVTRSIARSLLEAGDGFRFDLSDLQPAAFGSTPDVGMQGALRGLLISHDVSGTAKRLEAAAAAAYAASPR